MEYGYYDNECGQKECYCIPFACQTVPGGTRKLRRWAFPVLCANALACEPSVMSVLSGPTANPVSSTEGLISRPRTFHNADGEVIQFR